MSTKIEDKDRARPPTLDELRAEVEAERQANEAARIAHEAVHARVRGGAMHRCFWPDCDRLVPLRMLMCSRHWFTLPKGLRDRVWAAYRPGQESISGASAEYVEALHEVRTWTLRRTSPRDYLKGGIG